MKHTYYFDTEAADRVCQFFDYFISHVNGELSGSKLALEKWQRDDIIRPLFGWKRKSDNTRKYRTAFILVPRKNGKSTLGAGIALYLLLADNENGAQIYSAAGDREQARIIFDIAKHMILSNYRLNELAQPFQYSIVKKNSNSVYKVISADASTKHGFNAHGILFDELHTQPNRDLWDVLTTSVGSRRQPLTIAITTAGYDRQSICYEMYEYAKKVQDGIIQDETFLPVIYESDLEDDIFDEKTWKKANPGFGTIVKRDYFEQEINKIRHNPSHENTFRRLHLNQWTTSEIKWLTDETWMQADGIIDLEKLKNKKCFGGLDLATISDITALVLLFEDDDNYTILPFFFVPEDTLQLRVKKDRVNYDVWQKSGYLITTPGNTTDYNYIKSKIIELKDEYDIVSIAYDRWNSSQLVNDLVEEGVVMTPYGQGFASMSAPTKELERLVISSKINHGGNPVLRWMVSNTMMKSDPAGNIKPDKQKSREKIDGVVALVMALGDYLATDTKKTISIYEERDMIVL